MPAAILAPLGESEALPAITAALCFLVAEFLEHAHFFLEGGGRSERSSLSNMVKFHGCTVRP